MNGKLSDELGVCDVDKKKYKARFGSLLIGVPSDTTTLELVVEVANFNLYIWWDYQNSSVRTNLCSKSRNRCAQRRGEFFCWLPDSMFIYQIILFFLYQHGKPYLYLGLICLIVALRAMVTHGGSFLLLDLYPQVSMEFWKKLEFFRSMRGGDFSLYSFYLFPAQAFKKPIPVFIGFSILLCLLVVFTPHEIYYQVLDVCHGFAYLRICLHSDRHCKGVEGRQ